MNLSTSACRGSLARENQTASEVTSVILKISGTEEPMDWKLWNSQMQYVEKCLRFTNQIPNQHWSQGGGESYALSRAKRLIHGKKHLTAGSSPWQRVPGRPSRL